MEKKAKSLSPIICPHKLKPSSTPVANRPSPDWFLNWDNETTVIVASGPSASEYNYDDFKGRAKFIVTNQSWRLVPWADVLLGADASFWNRTKGVPDFKGLKVTVDFNASRDFGIKLIRLDRLERGIIVKEPGIVGKGANSGFYAANLAVQFGSKKLVLSGFDMNLNHGVHWHGEHPKGMSNPRAVTIDKWRKLLDQQAKTFQKLGVQVINVSMISSLEAYPKMTLSEALT